MSLEIERGLIDGIGWQILCALQRDARISYAELGKLVGLSSPAVAERVRRMEDAGVITGYHAEVNPTKLGLHITAFMRISTTGGREGRTGAILQQTPEVLECHRVTGSDCFIVKVQVRSVVHLENLIDRLTPHGELTTSIVLSSPVTHRMISNQLLGEA